MDTSKVQSYDQTTQGTGMRGTQGYEQGNVGTMQDQPTGTTGYGQTAGGMGPGGYGRVILTIKSGTHFRCFRRPCDTQWFRSLRTSLLST
jgi:hypothetical protein